MSLAMIATLACDGCGRMIVSPPEYRSTRASGPYVHVRRIAEKEGWLFLSRGRYLTNSHYCPACADKPAPKWTKKP